MERPGRERARTAFPLGRFAALFGFGPDDVQRLCAAAAVPGRSSELICAPTSRTQGGKSAGPLFHASTTRAT